MKMAGTHNLEPLGAGFLSKLDLVRRREILSRRLSAALSGLVWGSLLGVALLALRFAGIQVPLWLSWLTMVACCIGFVASAIRSPILRAETARRIDVQCAFQDHMVTALEFAAQPRLNAMQSLQLRDAVARIRTVDPVRVVPRVIPKHWPGGLAALVLLAVCCPLVSGLERMESVLPSSAPTGLEHAIQRDVVGILQGLAFPEAHVAQGGGTAQPIIDALFDDVIALTSDLSGRDVTPTSALRTLGRIERAVIEAQRKFNHVQRGLGVDALAATLSSQPLFSEANRAIRSGDWFAAADYLDNFQYESLSQPSRLAFKKQLNRLVGRLQSSEADDLASAVAALADGLDQTSDRREPQKALTQLLRQYAAWRDHEQRLSAQLTAIADARTALTTDTASQGAASMVLGSPIRSTKQSDDRPALAVRPETVTGRLGSGPTRDQTTIASRDSGNAHRSIEDSELAAQRIDRTPIHNRESLPPGHRQTVKLYFDRINAGNDMLKNKPASDRLD